MEGLRLATAADVPALAALYADAARALGPSVYSPAQVAAWAQFGRDTPAFRDYVLQARTWVAETTAGAPPRGFCGIAPLAADEGEVHSLYVRPGLMRQGLGSALLQHALADARQRGLRHFSAWATPLSRPVFERAGLGLVHTVVAPYEGVLFERYRVSTRAP
jgi:putative acetyltransferase